MQHLSILLLPLPLLLLLSFALPLFGDEQICTAHTSTGTIRGKVKQIGEGATKLDMDIFFGIPYAKPPNGELRFEKTRSLPLDENGTVLVDAFDMPSVCVPHHRLDNWTWDWDEYSEDCLYMNIFAPHQMKPAKLLPTLVIVYSGGFETQSMRRYKDYEDIGRKYLSRGIVVIAVQFRIGYFGFSSLGDANLPGNLGYWDLAEALKWIVKNGASFGADPRRITLFGYSSSATTVATLAMVPHTRDLFQQSIQMSGSIFTSKAASSRVVLFTRRLAQLLKCHRARTEETKKCLKEKTIDQFMEAMDIVGPTIPDMNYDLFGPIIDGDFLTDNFAESIRQSRPKPTMLGLTELDPFGYTLVFGNNSLRHLAIPHSEFATFGPAQFRAYLRQKVVTEEYFGADQEKMLDRVVQFYTAYDRPPGDPDNWFYLERVVHVLADIQFVAPLAMEIRAKPDWPLFLYINKYANGRKFPEDVKIHRNFHDLDHGYVFRHPYQKYKFDEADERMETMMVNFVANFIIDGNPSSSSALQWPSAAPSLPFRHLEIDLPSPRTKLDFPRREGVQFWAEMASEFPQWDVVMGRPSGANSATAIGGHWMTILTAIAAISLITWQSF